MSLTSEEKIVLILIAVVILVGCGIFLWRKFNPLTDCLDKVKALCKPYGDVTCEEYRMCVQRSDFKQGLCKGTWVSKNCTDKAGPGKGTIDGKTLTWEGPYFKISTQGGGGLQSSIPEIDLTKIDTIVLKLDFSDKYRNNNTDSEITVGLGINMKVKDLVAKYPNFTAEVSDSTIIPGDFKGLTKLGNIYVGDSTIESPSTSFVMLTSQNLKNTNKVITLKFSPK